MLSSVTISLLVLALGGAVVEGRIVNELEVQQTTRRVCPANQIFSYIGSFYSNQFRCKAAGGATSGCYWTNYLRAFGPPLRFSCRRDEVVSGMISYFSSRPQDSRFKLQCCRVTNMVPRNCYYTAFVNNWGRMISYNVPTGKAIKGVYSVHNNKDIRWQFYLCDFD
ncbi:hypothetical protein BsWGS_25696 [Bradybaena similaris]